MYGHNCSNCGAVNSKSNPANYPQHKSNSWGRAFGRGIAGIFLFLFGIGMILILNYYFSNLDNLMRGMYYGGDPMSIIIIFFVIFPVILLSIGGVSIYYGMRIISKT